MVTESLRDMAFYLAVFELNEKRLKPVCPLNPDHSVTTVPSVRCDVSIRDARLRRLLPY